MVQIKCPFALLVVLCLKSVECSFSNVIHYPEEVHLKNIRQLTWGGQNAEAYFSFDNRQLIYQSSNAYGDKCDQIYRMDLDGPCALQPRRVSTGLGVTTCSYFLPDNKHTLFASSHQKLTTCPGKKCEGPIAQKNETLYDLCHSAPFNYTWDLTPEHEIYVANEFGHIVKQITNNTIYDAEATVSPDGKWIVYTSMESGDPELYVMSVDGTKKWQVTNTLGYDGGAYFGPDSETLVFRASRPQEGDEADLYKALLAWDIVSPIDMELFTIHMNGTNMKQVTKMGGANWAPFWAPNGYEIIFSSNYKSNNFGFNLYTVGNDGANLKQITFDPIFDAFPMFSFDGKYLVWESHRNATVDDEFNIFIAEWVEYP
jgi:TolB protein